ncbi:MAG: GntR family transcriptional regulator [Mesorhizobium sp.]|nr:MAG: GntR family transcriptional regulator [Mesorhizobium sp.]
MAKETKNTLRDSVYSALKAMIVTGQIPPGSRVTENDIAAKLTVSRTPVREAFNRLERDGLVTGRPRQGYVVTEFDINMFREAFEIRELLDGHATELAATAATEQDKARLARAHVRGSRDNVLRLLQAKSDYRNFLAKAS